MPRRGARQIVGHRVAERLELAVGRGQGEGGALQGLLGLPALRDVGRRAQKAEQLVPGVAHRLGRPRDPHHAAAGMEEAVLQPKPPAPLDGLVPGKDHAREVVGMHRLDPGLAQGLLRGEAREGAPRLVHEGAVAVTVALEDAHRGLEAQGAEARLAEAQGDGRRLGLGHVASDEGAPDDVAGLVAERTRQDVDEARALVGPQGPGRPRLLAPEGPTQKGEPTGQGLGVLGQHFGEPFSLPNHRAEALFILLGQGLVEGHEAEVEVEGGDHVVGAFEDAVQEPSLELAVGDVARDAEKAGDGAQGVPHGTLRGQEGPTHAVLGLAVLVGADLSGLQHETVVGADLSDHVGSEELLVDPAHHLLDALPHVARARGVDGEVAPFAVLDEHDVGSALGHRPQEGGGLAQPAHGGAALLAGRGQHEAGGGDHDEHDLHEQELGVRLAGGQGTRAEGGPSERARCDGDHDDGGVEGPETEGGPDHEGEQEGEDRPGVLGAGHPGERGGREKAEGGRQEEPLDVRAGTSPRGGALESQEQHRGHDDHPGSVGEPPGHPRPGSLLGSHETGQGQAQDPDGGRGEAGQKPGTQDERRHRPGVSERRHGAPVAPQEMGTQDRAYGGAGGGDGDDRDRLGRARLGERRPPAAREQGSRPDHEPRASPEMKGRHEGQAGRRPERGDESRRRREEQAELPRDVVHQGEERDPAQAQPPALARLGRPLGHGRDSLGRHHRRVRPRDSLALRSAPHFPTHPPGRLS